MFARFTGGSGLFSRGSGDDDDDEPDDDEEEEEEEEEPGDIDHHDGADAEEADFHPACRYRAENGALFTSTKCPPGPGLENSCELPFGLLYTPLAPQQQQQQQGSRSSENNNTGIPEIPCIGPGLPPILCLTCLGYLNLYATFDLETGIWTCPLCGAKNVAPRNAFYAVHNQSDGSTTTTISPALISPMMEFRQPLLGNNNNNDSSNSSSMIDVSTIIVVMDANLPRSEAHAVGQALYDIIPQIMLLQNDDIKSQAGGQRRQSQINLGLIVFDKVVTIYQLGLAGIMASADVFTTHQDLTEDHLASRMYLAPMCSSSSSSSSSSTATRSSSSKSSLSSSLDMSACHALNRCLSAVYGPDDADTNDDVDENQNLDNRVTRHTISPHKLSRLEMLKKKKQERLRKEQLQQQEQLYRHHQQQQPQSPQPQQPASPTSSAAASAKSPWTMARERAMRNAKEHYSPAHRCTGEAIQCAIDLTTLAKVAAQQQQHHHHASGGGGDPNSKASRPGPDASAFSRTSRILLFTNGCPNHGDGSVVSTPLPLSSSSSSSSRVGSGGTSGGGNKKKTKAPPDTVDPLKLARSIEYFDILARAACDNGTAVDVFCTGATELAVSSYQALVGPSSGYVLPHDSFDKTAHLKHNLSFLLKHTHVSSCGNGIASDTADDDDDGSNSNITMNGCVIDVRVTSFLTPTHLVGPGDLLQDTHDKTLLANERSAFALGAAMAANRGLPTSQLPSRDMLDTTLTRVRMGRVDPLSTFYVMFTVNDFFQNDSHAVFQCSVRFVSRDGSALVTRVSTHRLPIAKNVGEYVDAVDEEVVPVIMGKEAVYRSMFGRELSEDSHVDAPSPAQLEKLAYKTQQDLDATIARISGAFRLLGLEQGTLRGLDLTEEGGVRAAGSSVDFAFPPELSDALRRLYHLRRGPLLNPGPMRSLDDRADIRSLFLRFPLEDCLNMMAPSLWSTSVKETATPVMMLEEFPPETLALWEDCVIAADNYHTMFVWSGRQSSVYSEQHVQAQQECRKLLQRRSERRFPMPHLHVLSEGDSMSRRFTALLAPSHGDPIDHSLAHFPALARLSAQELSKLRSKFRFYDPNTDPSFRAWFWSVAGATSNAKDDGLSLCE